MIFRMRAAIAKELKEQPITALSTLAAVVVAAVGLGATYSQISGAAQALRAANEYTLRKDGRDLIASLLEDTDLQNLQRNNSAANEENAKAKLWLMVNHYTAIYRQAKTGGVDQDFAASYAIDFCGFIQKPEVNKLWLAMVKDEKAYRFQIEMRAQWCRESAVRSSPQ